MTAEPSPAEFLAARKAAGLTQAQAAKVAGVCLRTVQYWEAGTRTLSRNKLRLFLLDTGQNS